MRMRKICNNVTTAVNLKQLSTTPTEDLTLATTVYIVQSGKENTSSAKGAEIQSPHYWRTSINISDECATYRDDFVRMLKPFKQRWDGCLGHIKTAIHRVELNPLATRPLHSVPYRAELIARDFEKTKQITHFRQSLFNPLEPSGPHPLWSPRRRTELSDFA